MVHFELYCSQKSLQMTRVSRMEQKVFPTRFELEIVIMEVFLGGMKQNMNRAVKRCKWSCESGWHQIIFNWAIPWIAGETNCNLLIPRRPWRTGDVCDLLCLWNHIDLSILQRRLVIIIVIAKLQPHSWPNFLALWHLSKCFSLLNHHCFFVRPRLST